MLAGNSETLQLPGVNRPSASAFYIGERPEYVQAGEKGVRKKINGHAAVEKNKNPALGKGAVQSFRKRNP